MNKTCKQCNFVGDKSLFRKALCINCANIKSRKKYYAKNGRIPPDIEGANICSSCKKIQDVFYKGKKCEACFKQKKKIMDKQYQQTHKKEINANNKKYKQQNKKKIAVASALYRKNNKEKDREYREKNKDRYNASTRQKRKNNPAFRIRELISGAINTTLKKNGDSKSGQSCLNYLPYSIKELKIHLEKQFEPWMNWHNQGKYNAKTWNDNDQLTWTWQIDHIIPHSRFTYSSMNEEFFKLCWSLNNLRPYSAKQNLLDGNRRKAA